MPTLVDALINSYFARPEVIEGMKFIETRLSRFGNTLERALGPVGAAIMAVAVRPPSLGYEPYFVRRGVHPVPARIIARILVHRGRRMAAESRRRRAVVESVRFLARPGRKRSSIARRAEVLLAAWNETLIIERIFSYASLNGAPEFVEALKGAVRREDCACQRVTATATSLLPYLANPRGRKISAATAAHEFFLEAPGRVPSSRGYTWSIIKEDFVDEETEATRREFADPDFDPRPAYRRIKAREGGGRSISPRLQEPALSPRPASDRKSLN